MLLFFFFFLRERERIEFLEFRRVAAFTVAQGRTVLQGFGVRREEGGVLSVH